MWIRMRKRLASMENKKKAEEEQERLLQELKDKEDITLDGTKVKLYANIGDVSDVAAVLKSNAAGIGLFRSEFLYLEKKTYRLRKSSLPRTARWRR